ncbi:MAG TPA: response regulator [Anaeromyxobacteraceae bacterium]|nr:response regulator [Anaeromyxobacteraceae bacterium]
MAKDRYKYFRIEARELLDGLSRGALDLEKAPADRELVARLLRLAHTLKGAARVVQLPLIAELAHAAEDALGPHRDPQSPPVPRERVDVLLRIVDDVVRELSSIEPAHPAETAGAEDRTAGRPAGAAAAGAHAEATAAAGPSIEDFRSVRVDLGELDTVLDSVLQAGVQMTALTQQLDRLESAEELARALSDHLARSAGEDPVAVRARAFAGELRRSVAETREALAASADQATREIAQVRGSADRLRLLPARAVFGSLERACRDAARATERAVAFETAGGELRVDAHVLSRVRAALMHVVRNAVVHGIEPPGERQRRGKSPVGSVRVSVERRGNRLAFMCRDDGGGVDVEAVREAAVRKGLLQAGDSAALQGDALTRLLLEGGLTTRPEVSDLAGRGVGLDVVRETVLRLEGQVAIQSEPGVGAAVEMVVPMSLAAMTVLHAEVDGVVVALPLDGVRSTAFLEPSRIARTGDGVGVSWEGQLVPFLPLANVLGRPPTEQRRRFWSAIFVAAGGQVVAVGADRLRGTSDVVVRPLPSFVEAHAAVAGASLDAEGNPQVVLDPAGLVATASSRERAVEEVAPRVRPPILVIDDSLTTRMLEQSILESAGYEVELAVSGEEALAKARARRFGVFVVDVEMPGMDGFEFVRVTRADARLSVTPAILVTSRSAAEDRQQGMDAGASAYIVKGEFDQDRLLATIRELMG